MGLVPIASSLLNAAYFLPILYRAWFLPPPELWPQERVGGGRLEIAPALLWPPLVTALLALLAGLAAGPLSTLESATLIANREYGR